MTTFRIERLNKEFLRLIAELLVDVKNETAKKAMLTHVDVSKDLSHAKVYFTLLLPRDRETVLVALDNVKGKLRGAIGRAMRIRQVPDLHFIYDDSEQRARSMDELIDRVMSAERTSGADDEDDD